MASESGNGATTPPPQQQQQPIPQGPDQKTLNVWSKPIDPEQANNTNERPTITEAVGMIKADDFTNIANTPCARNAFLTGIAGGFGIGGVRFVMTGRIGKAANWAVGVFVLGSMGQYEWCQYRRRCEKRDMKRHIEVVNESRREQAKKLSEAQKEKAKLDAQKKAAEAESTKSWWPSKWW